jgi:hypothetical protein
VDLLTADGTIKAIPIGQNIPGLSGGSRLVFVVEEFLKRFYFTRNSCICKHLMARQQRGRLWCTNFTPVMPIAGQKFPRYFEGYLKFFTVV